MTDLSVYDNDPTLYLFTSLTAGSSHIITATSRIETILKANKIPFTGVDTATNDLARKLYGRRASGKKLPLLVKEGYVLGGIEEIEEWNEYGELKEAIGPVPGTSTTPAKPATAPSTSTSATTPSAPQPQKENQPPQSQSSEATLAMRQLSAEAATTAAAKKPVPANISTTNPLLAEKVGGSTPSTPAKAVVSPTKAGEGMAASGILSPRSIPLPSTPNATSGILSPRTVPLPATPGFKEEKKEEGEGEGSSKADEILKNLPKPGDVKPKMPPSMHDDEANTALNAGPVAIEQAGKTPVVEQRTSSVSQAPEEEIKKIESEQAIPEASSEEEEDEEEEEKESEEESEEEENTDPSRKGSIQKTTETIVSFEKAEATEKKEAEESEEEEDEDEEDEEDEDEEDEEEESEEEEPVAKPQVQSPKAGEKAGESVKD